jgi:hypothetical protein
MARRRCYFIEVNVCKFWNETGDFFLIILVEAFLLLYISAIWSFSMPGAQGSRHYRLSYQRSQVARYILLITSSEWQSVYRARTARSPFAPARALAEFHQKACWREPSPLPAL